MESDLVGPENRGFRWIGVGVGGGQAAPGHILEEQSAMLRDWTSKGEKPSGGVLGSSKT